MLNVGLIKIQPGEEYSEDGLTAKAMTKPAPLPAPSSARRTRPSKTALIRLHFVGGMNKETCLAIVLRRANGLYGQPLAARG